MTNPLRLAMRSVLALMLLGPCLLHADVMTDTEPVAKSGANRWVTPVNQLLTPNI